MEPSLRANNPLRHAQIRNKRRLLVVVVSGIIFSLFNILFLYNVSLLANPKLKWTKTSACRYPACPSRRDARRTRKRRLFSQLNDEPVKLSSAPTRPLLVKRHLSGLPFSAFHRNLVAHHASLLLFLTNILISLGRWFLSSNMDRTNQPSLWRPF